MPDDLERLQRKIEEGLEAVRELRRREAERKKLERPKLRVIKGGLVWATIAAGVEWFRDYRRTVGTLAVSGLTVTGAVIAEQPHSPGSDPPQAVKPPASIRPSVPHPTRPKAIPTPARPPRTSPPRTPQPVRSTPVAAPASTPPAKTAPPTPAPTKEPAEDLLPTTPSPALTSDLVPPATPCAINLLGVKLCLPRG